MGLSSSRLLYLGFTLCFIVLAFMPQAAGARWLDLCLAPTRVLGELASPIGIFARGAARAAESEVLESVPKEHEASRKLADDERCFALPDEESLISGRRFVHAQVVRRYSQAPDRIECALEQAVSAELVVGLPVVLSNSYVGRVSAVDPSRRRLIVHLVTDRDFRVGARSAGIDAGDPGAAMVVGSLAATRETAGRGAAREPKTPLVVHNPDRLGGIGGLVRVDEGLNPRAPFRELSQGFRLGIPDEVAPDRFVVTPEIDFKHGLFRVVIVLPPKDAPPDGAIDVDVFADLNWRSVRAYMACEPSLGREGVKIDLPRKSGAREHAAVIAGARLVGFISHAGVLGSDVAMLGDRGVSVPAQACVEGEVAPLVLGRLIALGRARAGGPARFLYSPSKPLEPAADGATARKARLFTGAGELGIPGGLLIGDTRIPCGQGPFVIEVADSADARLLRKLWVWRGMEREEAGGMP